MRIKDIFFFNGYLGTIVLGKVSLIIVLIGCRFDFSEELLRPFVKGSYLTAVIAGISQDLCGIFFEIIIATGKRSWVFIEVVHPVSIVVGKEDLVGGVEGLVNGKNGLFVGVVCPGQVFYRFVRLVDIDVFERRGLVGNNIPLFIIGFDNNIFSGFQFRRIDIEIPATS